MPLKPVISVLNASLNANTQNMQLLRKMFQQVYVVILKIGLTVLSLDGSIASQNVITQRNNHPSRWSVCEEKWASHKCFCNNNKPLGKGSEKGSGCVQFLDCKFLVYPMIWYTCVWLTLEAGKFLIPWLAHVTLIIAPKVCSIMKTTSSHLVTTVLWYCFF